MSVEPASVEAVAVGVVLVPVGTVLAVEPPLLPVVLVELDGGGLVGVVVVDEEPVLVPPPLGGEVLVVDVPVPDAPVPDVLVPVVPVPVVGPVPVGVVPLAVGSVVVGVVPVAVGSVVVGVVPVAVGSVVVGAAPVVLVAEPGPLASEGDAPPVVPAPPEGSVGVAVVPDPVAGVVSEEDPAGVAPVDGVAPPVAPPPV